MELTTFLSSPLCETLRQVRKSSSVRFDYVTHHCGLQPEDLQGGGQLSKYTLWTEKLIGEEDTSSKLSCTRQILSEVKKKISHPNFTKNWGYLNPRTASALSSRNIYQIYLTRPNFEQFKIMLNFAASPNPVLVKYARLKALENRNDTIIIYTSDAEAVRHISEAIESTGSFDQNGALPGFATLSRGNLSFSRLRYLSDTESNGQRWQRLIEKSVNDPQYLDKLSQLAQMEFIHLSRLLKDRELS